MSQSEWLKPKDIIKHLGISYDHLTHLRLEDLKEGKHYRNIARRNAARPTYQYHRDRIDEYLSQQAGKR